MQIYANVNTYTCAHVMYAYMCCLCVLECEHPRLLPRGILHGRLIRSIVCSRGVGMGDLSEPGSPGSHREGIWTRSGVQGAPSPGWPHCVDGRQWRASSVGFSPRNFLNQEPWPLSQLPRPELQVSWKGDQASVHRQEAYSYQIWWCQRCHQHKG